MLSWFNVVLSDIQPNQLVDAMTENQKGKVQIDKAALPAIISDLLIFFLHLSDKNEMITKIIIDNHSDNSRELK